MRRKPKTLTTAPTVYQNGRGGRAVVTTPVAGDAGQGEPGPGQGSMVTRQPASVRDLAALLSADATDPEVAAMARTIARRVATRRRRPPRRPAPGSRGPVVTVPYRYRGDDIDLDRTLDVLTEHPVPEATDIPVRDTVGTPTAMVLLVDVSGSMRGEKVRIAAATVAALAADANAAGDRLAVVAFWSDAAVLTRFGEPITPTVLLDRLVHIPAKGLTNVHFGLTVARHELLADPARRRVAVLLSDAVHNAGPDPRSVARGFPELHVLLETDGEHDEPLGRDIARLGNGRLCRVGTHRDVAPALDRLPGRF